MTCILRVRNSKKGVARLLRPYITVGFAFTNYVWFKVAERYGIGFADFSQINNDNMLKTIYYYAYEYFCLSKGLHLKYNEDDIAHWFAPENISIASQEKVRKAIMDSKIGGMKFSQAMEQINKGTVDEKKK
jgi:hypothetical protein